MVGLTEPNGGLHNAVKNPLHLGWRSADDVEDLTDRGLMFKRHAQLAFARLLRLEQPRVLDGNHGLVGEGSDYLDLAFNEWAYFGSPDYSDLELIRARAEHRSP